MIKSDKILHFFVSMAICMGISYTTNIGTGILSTLMIGAVKEIFQLLSGSNDAKEAQADMIANILGTLFGAFFTSCVF